jgi:hypothetical protein
MIKVPGVFKVIVPTACESVTVPDDGDEMFNSIVSSGSLVESEQTVTGIVAVFDPASTVAVPEAVM